MKFYIKTFFAFILYLNLSLTVYSAPGVVKLFDFLINESGMLELLGKNGISGEDAIKATNYTTRGLKSLNTYGDRMPTRRELRSLLRSLPNSGEDGAIKKELIKLLNRPVNKSLTKKDVVTAINHIIWLANRHGNSGATVLACSDCIMKSLSAHGFKFTLEYLQDPFSVEVLTKILPRDPKEIKKYLNKHFKRLGFGSFSRINRNMLGAEEEKSLALFIGLAQHGSKKQKALIEAIKAVSTKPDGTLDLFNPNNHHKLWKLFSEEMGPKEMDDWTTMLHKVAAKSPSEESKKEAFYSYLKKRVGDDPALNQKLNDIKMRKCFFK